MKPLKTIISKINSTINPTIKTVEPINKQLFINNDGTVAENKQTYRQFKADLNNRSYGW